MVDIHLRLKAIFPDITFGAFPGEADCVVSCGKIIHWGRPELQPIVEELSSVTEQAIQNYIDSVAARQAVLDAFAVQLSEGISGLLSAQFKGVTREKADEYIESKVSDPGTVTLFKIIAYNLIEINAVIEALEGMGKI